MQAVLHVADLNTVLRRRLGVVQHLFNPKIAKAEEERRSFVDWVRSFEGRVSTLVCKVVHHLGSTCSSRPGDSSGQEAYAMQILMNGSNSRSWTMC